MYEYAIDNRRIMQRAYAWLAAGDVRGFLKPIAPGIVGRVLATVLHPFPFEVLYLRVVATEFTVTSGRVIVSGLYMAARRADRAGVCAPFRHEWNLTYGVAWRFVSTLPLHPWSVGRDQPVAQAEADVV
jgi:hypothetical protein